MAKKVEKVSKKKEEAPVISTVENCVNCEHAKKVHYGSEKSWCNHASCVCTEFK